MALLELLTVPAHGSASHRILSPGGYEGWLFDAVSEDGALHLLAGLHEAWALDVRYARRYARYLRAPTRVAPPIGRDFAAVTFSLFQNARVLARFVVERAPAGEVSIAPDGSRVRVGASHASRIGDRGVIQLNLRGGDSARTIAANLTFRPTLRADREMALVDPARGHGMHQWICADARCDVDGEISIFDGSGTSPITIPFAGAGGHDHFYGTRPMSEVSRLWTGGRVVMGERVIAFQCAGGDEASIVVAAKGGGIEQQRRPIRIENHAPNEVPERIQIGDLELTAPQLYGRQEHQSLIGYTARSAAETGSAMCRLIFPPAARRRWGFR